MQPGASILLLLTWVSAACGAPPEGPQTPEVSLGVKVLKKQEECEGIIRETIDLILNDENSDPHDDFPIPDDNYHDCKEELDKLKREYMKAYVDKSTNTGFFHVKVNETSSELISVPAEEGADVKDLEFDVNEELCVTNKICSNILGLMVNEKEKEAEKRNKERFAHCHILLEIIKHKYAQEKKLDEEKLKEERGLKVMCEGKPLLLPIPHFMNNLDSHAPLHDLFLGDAPHPTPGEGSTVETPAEDDQGDDRIPEEEKRGELPESDEKPSKDVKGTPSKANVEKANFISCVLVVFALFTII